MMTPIGRAAQAENETPRRDQRTVNLTDAEIRITALDNADQIEIVGNDGELLSRSVCVGPQKRFDTLVDFFRRFQEAVQLRQRDQVVEMLHVPLRVGAGEKGVLRDRKQILANYEGVFDDTLRRRLAAIDPRRVFCNWQGAMIGNGAVWAEVYDGELRVITINRPAG